MDMNELGQSLGDGEGQEGLVCCSPGVVESWPWLGDWAQLINNVVVVSSAQQVYTYPENSFPLKLLCNTEQSSLYEPRGFF